MSEDVLKVLAKKAQQFEDNKERSMSEIRAFVQKLFDKLKVMENTMLDKVENTFDENIFSSAIARLDESMTFNTIKDAEETSKKPVPEPVVPKEGDLERIVDEIAKAIDCGQPAPGNVIGKAESPGTIELTWNRTPGATGYCAEIRPASEGTFREAYNGTEPKATIRELATEEKHLLRVRAFYGSEKSGWSSVVEVRPWCLCVPQNVTGTSDFGDTIKVTWEEKHAPTKRPITYNVELQESGGNPVVAVYDSPTNSFVKSDLLPEKTYLVRVRSSCDGAMSEWSQQMSVTTKALKCPKGHNLMCFPMNEVYEYFGIGSVNCDCCRNSFTREQHSPIYCCRVCDYDLCSGCIKKPLMLHKKQCQMGHPLVLMGLGQRLRGKPYAGIICDICRTSFRLTPTSGSFPIFHCRVCDYDICPECARTYM